MLLDRALHQAMHCTCKQCLTDNYISVALRTYVHTCMYMYVIYIHVHVHTHLQDFI